MANRRWVCPECGVGVNAPERLRMNDVRRFCLACSSKKKKGPLVERTIPAKAREQRRKAEAKAASRAAKREARAAAEEQRLIYEGDPRYQDQMHKGVDLYTEWLAMLRICSWRNTLQSQEIKFSKSETADRESTWGWHRNEHGGHDPCITFRPDARLGKVFADMAHVLRLRDGRRGRRAKRTKAWRAAYALLIHERYQIPSERMAAFHEAHDSDSLWPWHRALADLIEETVSMQIRQRHAVALATKMTRQRPSNRGITQYRSMDAVSAVLYEQAFEAVSRS